jgi:hypothetical protein
MHSRIEHILEHNIASIQEQIATIQEAIEDARIGLAAKTAILDEVKEKSDATPLQVDHAQHEVEHAADRLSELTENEHSYRLLMRQFAAVKGERDLRVGLQMALRRAQDDARNWKDEEARADEEAIEAQDQLKQLGRERRLVLKNTDDPGLVAKAESDHRRMQWSRNRALRRQDRVANWSRRFAATVTQWQTLAADAGRAHASLPIAHIVADAQAAVARVQGHLDELATLAKTTSTAPAAAATEPDALE